jgi:heat shock protein HtpX
MNGVKTMMLLAASPLDIVPTSISGLFSTHPATASRIAALEQIARDISGPNGYAPAPDVPMAGRRRSALDPNSRS